MAGFGRQGEPVFLKEDSAAREQLRQLEALHAQADEKLRGRLEQDMRLVKAGIAGEEQILFELRSSHLPLFVLHDLFLRDGELSAQIDFAVVTPKLTFFLECKNLFGNIEIGADGSFVRTLRVEGQPVREGIYSPVTQNERHLELLKALRAKSMGPIKRALFLKSFAGSNRPLVVLANPKTVLDAHEAPEEIRGQVIRADQLVRVIKESGQQSRNAALSPGEMERAARGLLSLHVQEERDYTRKYRLPAPAAPKEEPLPAQEKERCPLCGSRLVRKSGKFGPFWGCCAYPKCRYTRRM